MNEKDTIRSININYANLLEDLSRNNKLFEGIHQERDIINKLREKNRIVIPGIVKDRNLFQTQIAHMFDELNTFWKENCETYIRAVSNLDGLNVYSSVSDPDNLAIYFDTIIVKDPLLGLEGLELDEPLLKNLTIIFMSLYRLIPLLRADPNYPIVVMDPIDEGLSLDVLRDYHDNAVMNHELLYRTDKNLTDVLNRYSESNYKFSSLHEWQDINSEIINLDELFSKQFCSELLQIAYEQKLRLHDQLEIHDLIVEKRFSTDKKIYQAIINALFRSSLTQIAVDSRCQAFLAEQLVSDQRIFKLMTEAESYRLAQCKGFTNDMAAVQSLNLPLFKWVKDMSIQDIVRFRESGGLENVRESFRKERSAIKRSSIADFPTIAKSAENNLREMIKELNNCIASKESEYRKLFKLEYIDLSLCIGIALLSIIVPPLLAAIGTAATIGFGSKSIYEIFKDRKEGKKQIAELKDRPVGILAKYI